MRPTTLTASSGLPRCGGAEGIRASSPACETGMSEPVGADLPEARDGEGQLSNDALRSPPAGASDRLLAAGAGII